MGLGIRPDLRRLDDTLADRAEAARVRHYEGERSVGVLARLERVDRSESSTVARSRHEGAVKDARIARVIGGRNDRREKEEHIALELAVKLQLLKNGQFDRGGDTGISKVGEDARYEAEHQKRQDVKTDSRSDKADRPLKGDRELEREESMRQRLEERAAAKADSKADKDAEKKDDKAQDKADKKADAAAEKKADKADALKDRADDRKDVRTEAKIETASDKKTP